MSEQPPAASSAGSRRFWWTVLAFAAVNAAVLAAVFFPKSWMPRAAVAADAPPAALRVEKFLPGDRATVGPRAVLTWRFDADVAAGPGPLADAPGEVVPAVPGKWRWADAKTLEFAPDADFPRATAVTVTLSPQRLRTPAGRALDAPVVSTVQTKPLELLTVRHVGRIDDEPVLELAFNDAVDPAEVTKYLTVADKAGPKRTVSLVGRAAGKLVRVKCGGVPGDVLATDGELRVTLAKGLVGSAGPLGLPINVAVPVIVAATLSATEAHAVTPPGDDPSLVVRFNQVPDLERVQKVLSVEPAVAFVASREMDHAVRLTGKFAPGTPYTIKLGKPPAGSPDGFPRPTTLSVFVSDRPSAVWLEHDEGYLGAHGNRTLMARAVNVPAVRVSISRVYDNNLVAWRNAAAGGSGYRSRYRRYGGGNDTTNFARPIATKRIELTGSKNVVQEVRLALDELLPDGTGGDGVYRVSLAAESATAVELPVDEAGESYDLSSGTTAAVVTLSDIGLTAKQGREGVTAWAVSLSTGKPIADVRVRLYSDKGQVVSQAVTDADGLATLKNVRPAPGEKAVVLLADRGGVSEVGTNGDATPAGLTWLDLRTSRTAYAEADTAGRAYLRDGYEAFVYTDRGVYRPGETAHLRTIVRGKENATPPSFPLKWQLKRPDLRDWKSEVTPLDADGSAGLTLSLPADLPTGRWTAQVGLPGANGKGLDVVLGSVAFQVEDYIPERIKVKLDVTGPGGKPAARFGLDDKGAVELQADYLFGRPAAGLLASGTWSVSPTVFAPAKWNGWTFHDGGAIGQAFGRPAASPRQIDVEPTPLDDKGHASYPIDAKDLATKDAKAAGASAGPWRVTASASVAEQGGRAVSTGQAFEIDAVTRYVGIKATSAEPRARVATSFPVALVAPDGTLAAADVELSATLYREDWNTTLVHADGRYRYQSTRKLTPVGEAVPVRVAGGNGVVGLTPPSGGRYVLVVKDPAGAEASVAFFAVDAAWDDNVSRADPEKIELVLLPPASPVSVDAIYDAAAAGRFATAYDVARKAVATADDKKPDAAPKFRVGDRARVLVRSPFAGKLLLCVETDGVVSRQVIDMPASQFVATVEVTGACRPNAYVTASVVRAVDPNAAWRAHRAAGVVRLPVDPADRSLAVQVDAPTEILPHTTLSAAVRVTDDAGNPAAGAAVTVAAVDEGVLRLTKFQTPDPLAFFTAARALSVGSADLYSLLMPEVAKPEKAVGGDTDGDASAGGRHLNPVTAKRVNSVALFTGVLHADATGVARVELPVGAFAGQLRLMAVAYTGDKAAVGPRFGSGEASTFVRSPVLVQSSWPRFAAPGDAFDVPVTVFNNTDADRTVRLKLTIDSPAGTPPLALDNGATTLELPLAAVKAKGEAVVRVRVVAAQAAGVARIRLSADSDGQPTFDETLELPVRPAAPMMTDGGYVEARPGAPAKLAVPADVLAGTRQLQVRVTPYPSLGVPRGLQYLDRYPYGCAEQTTSTAFPLVYLGDVGDAVAPGMFDRDRINAKVQAGVMRLMSMQTADGGLSMWAGGYESWPWASVYATHFLLEAKAAGHAVPEDFEGRLLGYCRTLLERPSESAETVEVQAYACYVLATAGKPPRATMSRLGELLNQKASTDDPDWRRIRSGTAPSNLAMAWLAAGRRDLAGTTIPKIPPGASGGRQLGGNVGSPTRDRAVLLTALLTVDPNRPEVAGLAKELADAGAKGQWTTTQETAFALAALGRYLKVVGKSPAYESVELWVDGVQVASADAGKPLSWDLPDGATAKQIEVRTAGKPDSRAFASWVQHGVPMKPPAAADNGMEVRRRYLDRDGQPVDVAKLTSGDLVQIEVTLSSATPLENVVIEDLLPAGLEAENNRLESGAAANAAVRGRVRQVPEAALAVPGLQTGHVEMRDDRVVVVGHLPSGGQGRFTYLARAVTPGAYAVPPVRAECMYDAGINSVSGGGSAMKVAGPGAAVAKEGVAGVR